MPVPACEHNAEPKYIFVFDAKARSQGDQYADVEGPLPFTTLPTARMMRREHQADEPDGTFRLAYVHTDGCRTEQA